MKTSFGRVRPGTWILIAIIVGAGFYYGGPALVSKFAPGKEVAKSQTLQFVTLPDAPKNIESTAPPVPMPSSELASVSGPEIRYEIWAWNSQMGLIFANGGSQTAKGSIMEKRGVNLRLIRQDDVPQMQAHLIQFAKAYQTDKNTREGVHFVSIMGDGAATFLAGVNSELERLGKEYTAEIIASPGKSLGEDKMMGPEEWRSNPQAARGKVVCGVIRDGDWNIAVKWAADNGIAVNPDETTYDPEALNFMNADNYIDAGTKYINDYSEERPVVRNGKVDITTGKRTVKVDAVVTWTPGDVNVAMKKGGLVSIVSTAEYRSQMANTLIGIKKFNADNAKLVENLIAGIFEGGDQVKGYQEALNKAGELSAQVYKEEKGDYWVTYYKGKQVSDKQGQVVSLGGSRVNNLADNLEYFGLRPGTTDVYKIVYTTFGDIVKNLYPKLVPSYPNYEDVVNLTYLKNVASTYAPSQITSADEVKYNTDAGITTQVSKRSWSITFRTGSAEFTPDAYVILEQIKNQALIGSGLQLRIEGHTDNVGSDQVNIPLSQQRAQAVADYLQQAAPSQFRDRITTKGFGATQPVATNASETGRSKNRRVDVIMGI